MFAGEDDDAGAIVVRDRGFFPFGAPGGFDGAGHDSERADWLETEAASGEESSTQKGKRAAIEHVSVKVAQHCACGARTHEAVVRFAEESGYDRNADLVGEITAYCTATGGGIVGLADLGEQKKAGVAEGPGRENYE